MNAPVCRGRQGGFLLSATIILLLVTSLLTLTLARRWEVEDRIVKERDLLWMGQQFRLALASYADATPPGYAPAPSRLEQLVRDERERPARQHLRRIYVDPMTGKPEWGLERSVDGDIVGVHSLSSGKPLVRDGLWPVDRRFEQARRYSDWVFTAVPFRQMRSGADAMAAPSSDN